MMAFANDNAQPVSTCKLNGYNETQYMRRGTVVKRLNNIITNLICTLKHSRIVSRFKIALITQYHHIFIEPSFLRS